MFPTMPTVADLTSNTSVASGAWFSAFLTPAYFVLALLIGVIALVIVVKAVKKALRGGKNALINRQFSQWKAMNKKRGYYL